MNYKSGTPHELIWDWEAIAEPGKRNSQHAIVLQRHLRKPSGTQGERVPSSLEIRPNSRDGSCGGQWILCGATARRAATSDRKLIASGGGCGTSCWTAIIGERTPPLRAQSISQTQAHGLAAATLGAAA